MVAACDERSLVVDDNDDENKEERLFISDRDFNWIIDRALKLNYLITGSSFWYLDATPDPRSTQPDVSLGNRKQQVTSNPPVSVSVPIPVKRLIYFIVVSKERTDS